MAVYRDHNGDIVELGEKLGQGGEASVYVLKGDARMAVKMFLPEKRAYYEPRLLEMIAHPPNDRTRYLNPPHISIAWAERMVYERSRFVGYVMPLIENADDIFKLYSPKIRRIAFPAFDWRLLHHVACNLAIAVNAYHAAGYVIGDLNAKNVKVHKNAMITMVDTDSIQVTTAIGQVLRCPVGVPEYTSPELQGIDFKTVDRDNYHDAFALSVMIFQLLMEGYHPFTGTLIRPHNSVTDPANLYCIQKGIYPYAPNRIFTAPKFAPDYNILHPVVRSLFDRCFVNASVGNRRNRPLPIEWYRALRKAEDELVQCGSKHWYYPGYGRCPWCEREGVIEPLLKRARQPVPLRQLTRRSQPAPLRRLTRLSQPARVPVPSMSRFTPSPPKKMGIFVNFPQWIYFDTMLWLLVFAFAIFFAMALQQFLATWNTVTAPISAPEATTAPGCDNAPSLIMHPGETVRVSNAGGLRGYRTPQLTNATPVAFYSYNTQLKIINGPVCVDRDESVSYWFWQVIDSDYGRVSWVAEGGEGAYYLR